MKSLPYHIFIDTNVLINDILFRQYNRLNSKPSNVALNYLLHIARRETFVASFSIVQIISTLERARMSQEIIRQEIQHILTKHKVINFTEKDIQAALDDFNNLDIEDTFQFVVSQKMRCQYIITENVKDFIADSNVLDISPDVITQCVALRKGKKIKTPDAIIAATALAYGYTIITNDEKDFSNIKGLKVINPHKL